MLYDAEQVKLMFDEHAILFYDQEGVTFYDAIRLFGNSAFEKSLNTVKAVIDKIKRKRPSPSPSTVLNPLKLADRRKWAGIPSLERLWGFPDPRKEVP